MSGSPDLISWITLLDREIENRGWQLAALCGGLSPLYFGCTPHFETLRDLLDLPCFQYKQQSF